MPELDHPLVSFCSYPSGKQRRKYPPWSLIWNFNQENPRNTLIIHQFPCVHLLAKKIKEKDTVLKASAYSILCLECGHHSVLILLWVEEFINWTQDPWDIVFLSNSMHTNSASSKRRLFVLQLIATHVLSKKTSIYIGAAV